MHIKEKLYSSDSSPMLIACRAVAKVKEGKRKEMGGRQNNPVKL